jgi:8-oxo-dGTP diphosphatase
MDGPKKIELLARGLAIRGTEVLVCRSVKHGHCYLPGGHVEVGEGFRAALARECMEEAGVAVKVGALCFVHEQLFEQGGRMRQEVSLVFHVEQGTLPHRVASVEPDIAFEWLPAASLGDQRFLPGGMIEQVQAAALTTPTDHSIAPRPEGWGPGAPFLSDGLG